MRTLRGIVGLAGRAGSGKTTCARWLIERHGAVEFSFAEPLKRVAQDVFGFSDEQVFGTQKEKEAIDPRWGISPRDALIRLGHSMRERVGNDVWLRACLDAVDRSGVALAVISDLRYPNEAEAVWRRKDGHVFRLHCPDAASVVDRNAPSERGVDEIEAKHVKVELRAPRSPGASALLTAFEAAFDRIAFEESLRPGKML